MENLFDSKRTNALMLVGFAAAMTFICIGYIVSAGSVTAALNVTFGLVVLAAGISVLDRFAFPDEAPLHRQIKDAFTELATPRA